MISSRIPGRPTSLLDTLIKHPSRQKVASILTPSYLLIFSTAIRRCKKKTRRISPPRPLQSRHFSLSSAGRDHDRGRPNRVARANGVHVRPTICVCVPNTILLPRGARASCGPLVYCCNRAFRSHDPARGPHEPVFFGNRRLRSLEAPLSLAGLPRVLRFRKRIAPGRFSIDW